jgi:guanosine-3',5'-bis(diphosphate) 3'-pyrophosphohydrolase
MNKQNNISNSVEKFEEQLKTLISGRFFLLTKAINYSAIAHRNQRRKDSDNTPYINHPIEVMHILSQSDISNIDILSCAVLHDTVEDTSVTYQDLINEFGKLIADMVMECSDDKSQTKVDRKKNQIEHAKHISVGAKLVKIADKISNLSGLDTNPPKMWSQDEIEGYFVWSYAVWLNLRGHNEKLDNIIMDLLKKRNLLGISQEELEIRLNKYYENIKYSE